MRIIRLYKAPSAPHILIMRNKGRNKVRHPGERQPSRVIPMPRPKWPINEMLLEACIYRSMTDKQIADFYDVSLEAVQNLRAKYNL